MNYPAASGRGIKIVLRPKGRGIKLELRNKGFVQFPYRLLKLNFTKERTTGISFIKGKMSMLFIRVLKYSEIYHANRNIRCPLMFVIGEMPVRKEGHG